ncbi:unnamed protein product [Prorocentrum cordatum]|uniref:cellulase n=1 Tax=Prorocentrum cordatum TaxID=2364126 RepID=A0ABN9V7D7_9DINO|nr:unnamed protein product [Polarella glacialis]
MLRAGLHQPEPRGRQRVPVGRGAPEPGQQEARRAGHEHRLRRHWRSQLRSLRGRRIPGAGQGQFTSGCTKQFSGYSSSAFDCGNNYGGCSARSGCSALPSELQAGCHWRHDWYMWLASSGKTNNPYVSFRRVRCPQQLTDISGSVPLDDASWPEHTGATPPATPSPTPSPTPKPTPSGSPPPPSPTRSPTPSPTPSSSPSPEAPTPSPSYGLGSPVPWQDNPSPSEVDRAGRCALVPVGPVAAAALAALL